MRVSTERRDEQTWIVRHIIGGLCGLLILMGPLAATSAAQESPASEINFNISAQPLGSALNAFAVASGWQVSAASELTTGADSPGVVGQHRPEQALQILLSGTGRTYRVDGPQMITLERAPVAPPVPVAVDPNVGVQPAPKSEKPIKVPEIVVKDVKQRDTAFAPARANVGVLGDRPIADIPFSVRRYSRDLLDTLQVQTLAEVLRNDPSVRQETTAGSFASSIVIRGFEVTNYFLDGMTGPISTQPELPVELIESVDVLKGPSSVLFGGGAAFGGIGGAVNFIPKRAPETGTIRSIRSSVQNRGAYRGSLDLGGRFGSGEQWGYRLITGGQIGTLTARNNDVNDYFIAGSFEWRPTNWVKFTTDFGHIRLKTKGYQDLLNVPAFGILPAPSAADNLAQPWTRYRTKTDYAGLRADIALAHDWNLELAGLWSQLVQPYHGGTLINVINPQGDFTIDPDWFDQDKGTNLSLRGVLQGKFNTGFLRHGLTISARHDRAKAGGNFGFFGLSPFTSNIYNPVYVPEPDRLAILGDVLSDFRTTTYQVTDFIELHPMVTLVAGGGYVTIEDKVEANSEGTFTPLGGVVFKPWENTSLYAGYSQGLEKGGRAPIGTTNQFQFLAPRVGQQIEVGLKQSWRSMQFGLAFFELERVLEFVNASNTYVQDGTQTHRGIELTAAGDISETLSLFGGLSVMDTEIQNGTVNSGKAATGVPNFSLRLFTQYRLPWVPGLAMNGGLNYRSRQFASVDNLLAIPTWATYDLGLSYDLRPTYKVPAMVRLSVWNISDEQYYHGVSFGGFGLALGEPRTVRLTVSYDF